MKIIKKDYTIGLWMNSSKFPNEIVPRDLHLLPSTVIAGGINCSRNLMQKKKKKTKNNNREQLAKGGEEFPKRGKSSADGQRMQTKEILNTAMAS